MAPTQRIEIGAIPVSPLGNIPVPRKCLSSCPRTYVLDKPTNLMVRSFLDGLVRELVHGEQETTTVSIRKNIDLALTQARKNLATSLEDERISFARFVTAQATDDDTVFVAAANAHKRAIAFREAAQRDLTRVVLLSSVPHA